MDYDIIHLPKDKWKGTTVPIGYTTNEYYDVDLRKNTSGFSIEIQKKKLTEPISHFPEEYDNPDKLYADYRENAYAWGVFNEGELIAAMETDPEIWSNRLRITEIWVREDHQKKGLGHELMEIAKEQARRERRRCIILETQSCNVNAIGFYQHEGFTLIGFDTCAYSNNDINRKEVRFEFGWFPEKKVKIRPEEIEIRQETEADYHKVEAMTQRAFWNKHHLGCDEHYLVHKLRAHKDYLPELSRIAVKDGEILGAIFYSKANVTGKNGTHEVLTFGPLCVDPTWQGCGVGELLIKETMQLAKEKGYKGIIIFGEPDYYPRVGFKTCDHFSITTSDGKNFDAFMAIELSENSLEGLEGKFTYSEVFEDLPQEEVEKHNRKFPLLKKQRYPGQWD